MLSRKSSVIQTANLKKEHFSLLQRLLNLTQHRKTNYSHLRQSLNRSTKKVLNLYRDLFGFENTT